LARISSIICYPGISRQPVRCITPDEEKNNPPLTRNPRQFTVKEYGPSRSRSSLTIYSPSKSSESPLTPQFKSAENRVPFRAAIIAADHLVHPTLAPSMPSQKSESLPPSMAPAPPPKKVFSILNQSFLSPHLSTFPEDLALSSLILEDYSQKNLSPDVSSLGNAGFSSPSPARPCAPPRPEICFLHNRTLTEAGCLGRVNTLRTSRPATSTQSRT